MHENTLDTLRVKNTKIKKELIDLKESAQYQGDNAGEVNKIFSQKRKTSWLKIPQSLKKSSVWKVSRRN